MDRNEILFEYTRDDDHEPYEVVVRIDGTDLTELIDGFELGAGMRPAGDAYGGLVPAFFRFGSMDDHFHGRTAGAKTPVLGCECGEWGCWPLMTRIIVLHDVVVWDSFEQPYRPERDYTGFGPFRFDRDRYDEAVAALAATVGADWQA